MMKRPAKRPASLRPDRPVHVTHGKSRPHIKVDGGIPGPSFVSFSPFPPQGLLVVIRPYSHTRIVNEFRNLINLILEVASTRLTVRAAV